ncbi:hypothetical protein [Lysinibacillus sphaericus]|uniref:hypothetical protein n=1 Tax=Lysinibacillus sphaericus TaxID=1421 RepID=UPI001CBC21B2|nr:hypothetical protein [Lysinibacillus sphaericus]
MGISVTDETLERATRVKLLIGREITQSERKSPPRFAEEPYSNFIDIKSFST